MGYEKTAVDKPCPKRFPSPGRGFQCGTTSLCALPLTAAVFQCCLPAGGLRGAGAGRYSPVLKLLLRLCQLLF